MTETNFGKAPVFESPDDFLVEVESAEVEGRDDLLAVGVLTVQDKAVVRLVKLESDESGGQQHGEVLAETRPVPHGILGEVVRDPRLGMREDDINRVFGAEHVELPDAV